MKSKLPDLQGRRVLVVEDEFFIAEELCEALLRCHAQVLGPAPDLASARRLLASETPDCAVLDINLKGQMVFDFAGELAARSVPFVFATGYEAPAIPLQFRSVARFEKPLAVSLLVEVLARECGVAP